MDAQIAMVRRTVEAEVDGEGDRGPRRVVLVAIETSLHCVRMRMLLKCFGIGCYMPCSRAVF